MFDDAFVVRNRPRPQKAADGVRALKERYARVGIGTTAAPSILTSWKRSSSASCSIAPSW